MQLGRGPVTLAAFAGAMARAVPLTLAPGVADRLATDRRTVDAAVAAPQAVYGLNTGLGANLAHRLAEADIVTFQRQLIEGRAGATGAPLPEAMGRGLVLARIVSASGGGSGLSGAMFDHLCALYRAGLAPVVPEHGSIGAGDLTQNAVAMLAVLGQGQMWRGGAICDAAEALEAEGLAVPPLLAKDAMALINHGGA
ncbi:MAG: aromatic amino acid lyase, partial [Pseudomonadota bacterium]|nr:aromatic amino acid lyase [Pseudomonadota bacterium]